MAEGEKFHRVEFFVSIDEDGEWLELYMDAPDCQALSLC
jgi:hypothetical protein